MDLDQEEEEDQMITQDNENSINQNPSEKVDSSPKQKIGLNSLPRNKEELASLIKHIQETVKSNILPKLQKCLDAKVCGFCFNVGPKGINTHQVKSIFML